MWPVQSQELKVEFFVPQATNSIWRRAIRGRCQMCGFSIAVGVVLTTAFTAAVQSPKASRNDLF